MSDPDLPRSNILAGLGHIVIGVGMLAVAAGKTIAAGRHRPKPDILPGSLSITDMMQSRPRPRRKPPESGLPVPAIPPRGPAPLQGGAAARIDFEA